MSKHLESVLQGVRQSLQLAPRRPFVEPRTGGSAIDVVSLRGDALMVVRDATTVYRRNVEQIKNCERKES